MLDFKPKNIIVRMPNWIGDAVCATPVLEALRRGYPEAEITAMCQANVAALFECDPALDELFRFHRGTTFLRRIQERSIIGKLKTGKYDLGVLLTHSFSSAWRFWQGKVRRKIGFSKDGRRFFLDDPLQFPDKKEHIVETYKRLLTPLGVKGEGITPRLILSSKEKEEAWELVKRFDIDAKKTLIGINPGAAYGSAKCWIKERFCEVAKRLLAADPSYVVLFFGDLAHKELVGTICADLPSRALNLAGQTTLRQLMALIHKCSIFLTNDSGPMHIADSLNVPLVALFGSTDPVVTGPYLQRDGVICVPQTCAPCLKRVCPIDFRCMKAISVDVVYGKMMEILKRKVR